MNAYVTSRGRRLLPLLAMGCVIAGWPSLAHADMLTSRLTDRASLTPIDASASGLAARVVFTSQEPGEIKPDDTEIARQNALTALALVMIVPAGMEAVTLPPTNGGGGTTGSGTTNNGTTGGNIASLTDGHPGTTGGSTGGTTGGTTGTPLVSTPEPGSLVLALSGSGMALLAWLRRKRKREVQPSS